MVTHNLVRNFKGRTDDEESEEDSQDEVRLEKSRHFSPGAKFFYFVTWHTAQVKDYKFT